MPKTQIGTRNSLYISPFKYLSGPTSSAPRRLNFIPLMGRNGLELVLVLSPQGEVPLLSLTLQFVFMVCTLRHILRCQRLILLQWHPVSMEASANTSCECHMWKKCKLLRRHLKLDSVILFLLKFSVSLGIPLSIGQIINIRGVQKCHQLQ